MSRIRRLGFAAIVMAAKLVGGAPAFAAEPLTTSGHVTDPDGFLSDDERETIETSAKSFYSTYTTFIDSLRSDYDFTARNAADSRKRQQAEEKKRAEQKKEQQKKNRGANIIISAVIVIAIVSNLWVWIRKERELEQGLSPTEFEDVAPLVAPVRREALRVATEARRRLSEAEEQVRTAEEDWNFARAHSVRASRLRAHVAYTDPRQTT